MCTNFRTSQADKLAARLGLPQLPGFEWPGEAWPGYIAPMLTGNGLLPAIFGLIPFFSKDGKDFRRTYNARSETADSKPSYRGPWKRRQFALIPMEAFFEPNYVSGKPVRWRIEREDQDLFTVAALWDTWRPKVGDPPMHSFSVLTVNADGHSIMDQFHKPGDEKRSIVIVPPDRRQDWLVTEDPLQFLLQFDSSEFMSQADPLPPRKPKLMLEPDA